MKVLVKYNNKEYYVTNPGELLRSEKNYLLDQLRDDTPCMGRYHVEYIKKNYNLSDYEYYLIVVCYGDESNIPRCGVEGCNNPKKFNLLGVTKKVPTLALGCCEKHSRAIKGRIEYEEQLKNGCTNISKAHRMEFTDEMRKQRSINARKQVENGTHPFLRQNSIELRKRLIEEGKNPIINMWRARDKLKELSTKLDIFDPSKMSDIEYVLCSERDSYKYRGDFEDECYFYITMLDDKSKFKIGVTRDMNKRSKDYYHNHKYVNPVIMYTGRREIIADLEYIVKKQFIHKVVLGTETYSINDYDEILEFIKYQISLID